MSDNVQVSIICTAYNHEKYIRQCLDGFVMQKGVSFEIIIHDDASTDGTANIIREYEAKYPNLFKPIYQTENQHSKHIPLLISSFINPLSTGKYVALCEGDDYWTDPYKLKKQYDVLENNPNCFMCGHKVNVVKENGDDIGYTCPRNDIKSSILPKGYICMNYDNAKYIHTSSFFFKANYYKSFYRNPPQFRLVAPVGDIPLLLYFNTVGNIIYINEVMSNYRFLSIGSWSYRNANDPQKEKRRRETDKKMHQMFIEYCNYTEHKYDDCFRKIIENLSKSEFWYCINNKDYKSLFKEFKYSELKKFGLDNKAMLKMICYIFILKFIKKD